MPANKLYVFIPRNVMMNYYQLSSTVHINLMSLACNHSLYKNIRIIKFCQIVSKVFHPRIVQTCPEQILVDSMEPCDLRWEMNMSFNKYFVANEKFSIYMLCSVLTKIYQEFTLNQTYHLNFSWLIVENFQWIWDNQLSCHILRLVPWKT